MYSYIYYFVLLFNLINKKLFIFVDDLCNTNTSLGTMMHVDCLYFLV
uniref:Uncharacterized protein n=1 Tax=Schmidtea mediterranea TaxID=79327 RepID=I1ZIF4_SCHMD|nr:hypothetical protein [Schmidtea mediterranea]